VLIAPTFGMPGAEIEWRHDRCDHLACGVGGLAGASRRGGVVGFAMTDTLAPEAKITVRDAATGKFLRGNTSGGRKLGSRNKLSERFVEDVFDEWKSSGKAALQRMAQDNPGDFCKMIANLVPARIEKTLGLDENLFSDIADFAQAYALAKSVIGADDAKLIEGEVDRG
jgi:hypothetical protein